ncbi:MAG: DUF3631 domain-containing protein [Promicromonosporaceae bacterium]|nr:DUF3631 domain-containing protein [Promicromonosporaceae bacterium]
MLDTIRRYTVQPSEHAYTALALYAAYTHAASAFDFAPRLLLTSPEKRSGKTRTMEVVGHLCHGPLFAANATVPALFRSLDTPRTVLFDEADTIFGTKVKAEQNEDLRGLINAGFQRGTPVLRTVGPNHVPTEFHVFAPVVMAAIGRLPDTITDRAVNIRLRRRKPTERVSPFRQSRNLDDLLVLRDELGAWIGEHVERLRFAHPETPLEDRAADLWEPLLAVADLAGGAWPRLARDAAVALSREAAKADADHSDGHELLGDCRQVLTSTLSGNAFVATETLLVHLKSLPESRWVEDALTGRRLAAMLKPYAIEPTHNTTKTARGYKVPRFTDAFDRYLAPADGDVEAAS